MQPVKRPTSPFVIVPTSDLDQPPEKQSRFTVRPLSQEERMRAFDQLTETETKEDGTIVERSRRWQVYSSLLLSNLLSVENFPPGQPLAWPVQGTDREKDDYLGMIEDAEIVLMGVELFNRSALEPTVPFSSPPGPTSTSGGNGEGPSSTTAPTAKRTRA